MRRFVALVAIVALAVPLLTGAGIMAQEATPGAEGDLPFELLGAGPSSLAPGHGLALGRVTFPAGFSEPNRHIHPYDYVVAVESGSLTFTIEAGTLLLMRAGSPEGEPVALGEEITIGAGDSFAGNPEVVWGPERVDGGEPFVAVGMLLGPPDAPETQYLNGTPTP